ncbi:hypothetical protein AB0P21_40965 [Kribbella sp. NPDC056861]|uniref:RICIN domain-containing protein n=1 Tax=Kribbella sp. NPDC056861 TaxID=3154857 RepID=UPI00343F63F0
MVVESGLVVSNMPKVPTTTSNRRPKRLFTRLLVLVGLVVASVAVLPAEAQAYEKVGHLKNRQHGGCLVVNDADEVYTKPCDGGSRYQIWHIRGPVGHAQADGSEQVTILNDKTGRCLVMWVNDADRNKMVLRTDKCAVSTDSVMSMGILDGVGANWQNVALRNSGRWALGHNLCLDSAAVWQAYTIDCNYGSYQRWQLY